MDRRFMMVVWLVVVMLMMGAVYIRSHATANDIRKDNIAACERGNKLRTEANATTKALNDFLEAAEQSRLDQAELTHGKERKTNLEAANEYHRLQQTLHYVKITDCEAAFK